MLYARNRYHQPSRWQRLAHLYPPRQLLCPQLHWNTSSTAHLWCAIFPHVWYRQLIQQARLGYMCERVSFQCCEVGQEDCMARVYQNGGTLSRVLVTTEPEESKPYSSNHSGQGKTQTGDYKHTAVSCPQLTRKQYPSSCHT